MKKEEKNSIHTKVVSLIKKTAKFYKIAPHEVTGAQFWSVATGKVDEWQIRKLGGFTNLRSLEFPAPATSSEYAIIPQSRRKNQPKYRPAKLENFTVHETNIRELFRLAKLKDTDILRVVVQPDTHCPEHDVAAVDAFCQFLSHYKPHGLINIGDFLENESVSHWEPKTSKPRRLVPEILKAREVLVQIDKAAGPQCVYKRFLIGNHEDWLEQALVNRVSEIYDDIDQLDIDLTVKKMLGLQDLGYRVIPLNEILQLGELHFIHGYYTNLHHAKKHLDVFGVNLMYGHLHDVQSHSGVSVRGVHEAISLGCLRSLNAMFMKGKPNNWSHAFGIVEYRIDGSYTRYVPVMINGKFSFGGKLFAGKA